MHARQSGPRQRIGQAGRQTPARPDGLEGCIAPRLISDAEIDRAADDIIANYPDPELEAFARHRRAWYRSEGAEQTYWRRVRQAVRQRLEQA